MPRSLSQVASTIKKSQNLENDFVKLTGPLLTSKVDKEGENPKNSPTAAQAFHTSTTFTTTMSGYQDWEPVVLRK